MAFHDMAGVFYAILFGLFVSLLVLLGELAWEAHKDVKESKVNSCLDFEHSLQSVDRIWILGLRLPVASWLVFYCCIDSLSLKYTANVRFKLRIFQNRKRADKNSSVNSYE